MYSTFLTFKAFAENQFTTTFKILRTDGGGEYTSNQFVAFLNTSGIKHELSCPHTSSQNGISERKHRHLVKTTIALLHQSCVPLHFLFDVVATAIFLINRLPSSKLHNMTPFEKLFHKSPDFDFLKVFGCRCYPWLRPYASHKLAPRSIPCIFLGYHPSYKGYRCLDPITHKVYVSRHVTFDEHYFPFSSPSLTTSSHASPSLRTFFWGPASLCFFSFYFSCHYCPTVSSPT